MSWLPFLLLRPWRNGQENSAKSWTFFSDHAAEGSDPHAPACPQVGCGWAKARALMGRVWQEPTHRLVHLGTRVCGPSQQWAYAQKSELLCVPQWAAGLAKLPKNDFKVMMTNFFEKEVVKLVMQRCALLRKFTACLRFHNQLRFCSFRYFLFKSMQSNRFVPILKYSSFTTRKESPWIFYQIIFTPSCLKLSRRRW